MAVVSRATAIPFPIHRCVAVFAVSSALRVKCVAIHHQHLTINFVAIRSKVTMYQSIDVKMLQRSRDLVSVVCIPAKMSRLKSHLLKCNLFDTSSPRETTTE